MLTILNLITNNYFLKQKLKVPKVNSSTRRITDTWQGNIENGKKIIDGKLGPDKIVNFNKFLFLRDLRSEGSINSRAIAREIVSAREIETIVTTNQLIDVVGHMVPEKNRNQFLARIFQAIRIDVNDEMKALEEMLLDAVDMLNEGGRLVVMSHHSLKDRMVKNLMKKGNIEGVLEKDFFGNPIKDLKEVTRKVIVATKDQIMENTRARSAKLRIAEKG